MQVEQVSGSMLLPAVTDGPGNPKHKSQLRGRQSPKSRQTEKPGPRAPPSGGNLLLGQIRNLGMCGCQLGIHLSLTISGQRGDQTLGGFCWADHRTVPRMPYSSLSGCLGNTVHDAHHPTGACSHRALCQEHHQSIPYTFCEENSFILLGDR